MKKFVTDNAKTRKDDNKLKGTCAGLKGKCMELEAEVTLLRDEIQDMKKEFQEEHNNFKKKFEDHIYATQSVSHRERPIEMPKPNDALVLGELCWRVQSIYKNVLPLSEYDERVSYKIDYMEENLGLLEDDQAQTSDVKQAWKQVLEILNWKEHNVKRLARAVRGSSENNLTAKKCCFSPLT